jgi:hypothetical protein
LVLKRVKSNIDARTQPEYFNKRTEDKMSPHLGAEECAERCAEECSKEMCKRLFRRKTIMKEK